MLGKQFIETLMVTHKLYHSLSFLTSFLRGFLSFTNLAFLAGFFFRSSSLSPPSALLSLAEALLSYLTHTNMTLLGIRFFSFYEESVSVFAPLTLGCYVWFLVSNVIDTKVLWCFLLICLLIFIVMSLFKYEQ